MNKFKRHIFPHTIIALMMVLFCLPCPVRQNIKQALDLPIERFEKPEKTTICQSTTVDVFLNVIDESLEKVITGDEISSSSIVKPVTFHHHSKITHWTRKRFVSVPIFLLHEQYLI